MRKRLVLICLVAAIATAATATGWYHADARLREIQARELESIDGFLKDDQDLLKTLQIEFPPEKGSGILGSYLAAIRSDGVAKHANMKTKLDRLAENNAGILALINTYSPHARTKAFNEESQKFQHYAIAWRDRWNSVMELYMAGGNYPVAGAPFPKEFSSAVQAEMEAAI